MTARDKFTGIKADFWDCSDPDRLTHLDPISALEAIVENHRERCTPTEEVIRQMGEISVDAYRRSVLTEKHIDDAVDRAIEKARESLEEESELGDDDTGRPMFELDVLAKHRAAFEAAVRALVADARVWRCDVAVSVELSPDETIEILRVERPEWFEELAAAIPEPTTPEANDA